MSVALKNTAFELCTNATNGREQASGQLRL
jgi:hypothetical protein